MAVAWAAILVPFLVFLNPSTPHDLIICGTPLWSVTFIMVLFGETLILQTGISLNGTPLKRAFGVFSSGKRCAVL